MNKKTSLSIALSAVLGTSSIASADTLNMTFSGSVTLVGGVGQINTNSDAIVPGVFDGSSGFDGVGSRTPITGTADFDTATGAGHAIIDSFSFFGGGLMDVNSLTFQAIGDGFGSTAGTLVAGVMDFNWNGNLEIPVTLVFDAAGFFGSIGSVGTTWAVGTNCTGCATSATPNTTFGHAVGAVPMAMTTWDTAGITMGSLFPLSDAPTEPDAIAGVPMTTNPFPGQGFNIDFTAICNINVPSLSQGPPPVQTGCTIPSVPIPSAVWLFGSGLIGLIGLARRKTNA